MHFSHRIFQTFVVALFAFVVSNVSHAKTTDCSMDRVLGDYRQALKDTASKKYLAASKTWVRLSNIGFAPAQRKMAFLKANGTKKKLVEAAFWAGIASFYGSDAGGFVLKQKIDKKLSEKERKAVEKRIKSWTPSADACWKRLSDKIKRKSTRNWVLENGISVQFQKNVPGELVAGLAPMVPNLFEIVRKGLKTGGLYLSVIDRIEIKMGDRYDRFVGWKRGKKDVLVISTGNFLEQNASFAATAILQAVLRRVYVKMPKSYFLDHFSKTTEKKLLVGSVYPDIDNQLFFTLLAKTLKHAKKLPKDLAKNITAIDEIRYMPQSKHFHKFGTVDAAAAYYDAGLKDMENRIIMIRRDLRWSSEVGLLLTLVHEGTHILQDARGDLSKDPQNIRFECEATENQIKAAQALDAPPSLVENAQYLQVCEKAQIMVNRWKDKRLLGK